jgi:hypothetical protein
VQDDVEKLQEYGDDDDDGDVEDHATMVLPSVLKPLFTLNIHALGFSFFDTSF